MMRYLTIALTKGRLAKQTMKLLEQIGISCEEMNDPATRRLIFTDEARRLRFFLAKGPDVPTYVEYGAADIGVVGEDTIMEEDRKIYEVLDLGELAPIVGLSEVIVDIVETGSTLKSNGLKVLEEVCPLSARVVVNPVSMRMENGRITALLREMNEVLTREQEKERLSSAQDA